MPTYSVTVLRFFEEGTVEIDVVARSKKEAEKKALKEARVNHVFLFGDVPDPEYCIDPSMDTELIETE